MEQMKHLSDFFIAIAKDPRIGVSHISLYCALLPNNITADFSSPICITSSEIMRVAKISGLGTYHKCIRDLHECGYIKYQPSYNHRKKSKVVLNSVKICFK
jgi:hypothetical protein